MDVRVLASSSAGNAVALTEGGSTLLIEAGIRYQDLQRGLHFAVSKLAGCLVSHEHQDHAKSAERVMRAGVDVYASRGTLDALGLAGHRARPLTARQTVDVDGWTILPFDTIHDAAEPLGFLIARAGYKILYLTDTAYSPYRFRGLTHLILEANYSTELLEESFEEGRIHSAHYRRVRDTHMSLEHALALLNANDLTQVQQIHLIHLSAQHSSEAGFKEAVEAATGRPTFVAPAWSVA